MNVGSDISMPAAVLPVALSWMDDGHAVALATVVSTQGSSPMPAGSLLAVRADGAFAGSVSNGCVEGVVIGEAKAVAEGAPVRLLDFDIADDEAWGVGLSCGGALRVHVVRADKAQIATLVEAERLRQPVLRLLATDRSDGDAVLAVEQSEHEDLQRYGLDPEICQTLLREERCRSLVRADGGETFVQPFLPAPVLAVFGASHVAQYLLPMAEALGYQTVLIDPRSAFASTVRFPDVRLICAWPDAACRQLVIDRRTAIVTLAHDEKLDIPALVNALDSPAFYIGAIGSRTTQRKRGAALRQLDYTDEQIARIHGPVGLNLGGRQPSEVALAIMAEITQVRYSAAPAVGQVSATHGDAQR